MTRRLLALTVVFVVLIAGCAGVTSDVTKSDGDGAVTTERPTETDTPATEDGFDEDAGPDEQVAVDGTMEVHFINVGQADATLIVGPTNETMLVDSGGWRNDGETVINYLEANDIDRIDHLVSTHGHADHIGGHAAVIEYYETEKDGVGAVYDSGVPHSSQTYENYLDAVEKHDVDLYEVREGDLIDFEGVDVTVLNPSVDTDADDLHDDSLAFHLAYGTTSILFTGDAEATAEERMLEDHGDALDADVYQAGHHGSNTSTTDPFLDAVDPAVTVVSSSYDSQYGHPHDDVLAHLADRGIDTYWTATQGTTVMTFDGATISVATQVDAPTNASELRDAGEVDADPTADTEERRTYGIAASPAFTVRPPAGGGVA